MADVMPDYNLEVLQLELQVAELELSLRRTAVRRAQIADEVRRLLENEEATHKAIADVKQKIGEIHTA